MEQNNKVLLLAGLIVLVAIVSFNFNGITGKAVSDISVEVEEASLVFHRDIDGRMANYEAPSKFVTVNINTNGELIDRQIDLYKIGNNGKDNKVGTASSKMSCSTSRCQGQFTHRLRIDQAVAEVQQKDSEDYFVRVYQDKTRQSFNSNTFKIVVLHDR